VQRVREEPAQIAVTKRFSFRLERTLRVPDDGRRYPLPPAFGPFPVYRSASKLVVPMRQWEALWISFDAAPWKPNAVQVASGGVNVLTGEKFAPRLKARPQNYIVCPDQPWLDGFKTEPGVVRQFVAAPLGQGVTVEEQLTGAGEGGLAIRVFEPKPGVFPDRKPRGAPSSMLVLESVAGMEMGLGAGGAIEQNVYPDPHGIGTWDPANRAEVEIALLNSEMFRELTGHDPPPSPISAADYSRLGFPWFRIYDEGLGDTGPAPAMRGVRSLGIPDEPAEPKAVKNIRHRRASRKEVRKPHAR
jgi:hypothetical protein